MNGRYAKGAIFERDLRIVRPDGIVRYVHSSARPVFSDSGDLIEYVGTILDITERKEEEAARHELRRRLAAAQEDERTRISREMHDQFGQQLSALTLKLAALKHDCSDQPELCEQIGSLQATVKHLDADVDSLVWELRPTALDDLGLLTALNNSTTRRGWAR